ncbi:MAG: Cysteine transporter substrate-binding protein [Caballeronia sp.]|jgi:cystine transport system substrate-binding protein|nr:Cysteine transporter substrate-binding protein [Caballeronia sp.]
MTNTKCSSAILTLCIASIPGLCSAQSAHAETDSLAAIRTSGVIRIANTQTSPPWSLIDNNNQPTGYDVDVAREVVRRMGVQKVIFIGDTWSNFVEGLKTGKYELVMNDLTPTPERMKQVDFSDAYGVEDFRIWVREGDSSIHGEKDLNGKRVGVVAGTSNESWSRAHLAGATFVDYDNGGLLFSDLANGRIDATVTSHFGGLATKQANHLPVKEVGEPLTFQLSAAAMKKGDQPLRDAINKALASMVTDGTIERLGKKWVGSNYDMVGYIKRASQN